MSLIHPNTLGKVPSDKELTIWMINCGIDSVICSNRTSLPRVWESIARVFSVVLSAWDIVLGLKPQNSKIWSLFLFTFRIPIIFVGTRTIERMIFGILKRKIEVKVKDKILHKVEVKETLYSLSKLYNVSVSEIMEQNKFLKNKGLQVGQTLTIKN